MYKIRKLMFQEHPILGNLNLDFCDQNNHAVDTIIFAGENGTGKSTILDVLYDISTHNVKNPLILELESDSKIITLTYYLKKFNNKDFIYIKDSNGLNEHIMSSLFKSKYDFKAIFSSVDINFAANELSSVTSLNLDAETESRKSSTALPTQIKQLLIDIQAIDDANIATAVRENPSIPYNELKLEERMKRFTNAFNKMFDNLSYSEIKNINGHKSIIFKKYNKIVPIDFLSSGEKQIVYRGCFLLKDVNALNGAFVFIDEPEISLHPSWQNKIMEYYKSIYTNDNNAQTSQIFAVTHSPFIVHNEYRKNDKVIVLARNSNGDIIVNDKSEYYKCNSLEVVKDAFNINDFSEEESIIYVAGRTDEMYFNKTIEVFNLNIPFKFKWIGYVNANGQEENTGDKSLDKVLQFLISKNMNLKNVCLYDCDTSKEPFKKNNIYVRVVPRYDNSKRMNKGIENALILDDLDLTDFYTTKIKPGDYGNDNTIVEFKKMEFCEHICSLKQEEAKLILLNLRNVIDSLTDIFNDSI